MVVAPNAFKGSLSAQQAAEAIARGVLDAGGDPALVPVADGGDGTLDALVAGVGGTVMGVIARGPLGLPVRAHLGRLSDGTGVVEMAQASGLALIAANERDPLRASSFGTGELLRGALARRPGRVIVGLGGSASVDGGMGIARALGVRFFDGDGNELPDGGGTMERLARIDASRLDDRVRGTPIVAAYDVDATLEGAIAFAAQKGATNAQTATLERGLRRLGERLAEDLGRDVADLPGAGAAGGAGAMLAALGAELRRGAEVVLDAIGFDARLAGAQLAITGEGRLDAQTLQGKAPYAVERRCDRVLVACAAIVGEADIGPGDTGFVAIRSLADHFGDPVTAMERAAEGVEALAAALVRSLARSEARP